MTSRGHWLGSLPLAALNWTIRYATRGAGLLSIATHHVYAPALRTDSSSIDAGANVGDFSRAILTRFSGRVVAIEPVPELLALVAEIAPDPPLRTIAGALAAADGELELHLSDNPEANSLDPGIARHFGTRGAIRVRGWSLPTLVKEVGFEAADLLKLDIEGAELDVLENAPAATIQAFAQITVEFHDFLNDRAAVSARVHAVRARMAKLGFRDIVFSKPWGHHADVLFINRSRIRFTAIELIHFAVLVGIALPLRGLVHRWRKGPA